MKVSAALSTAVLGIVMLAGCSNGPAQTASSESTASASPTMSVPSANMPTTPAATASATPKTNARGQIIKEIGEIGGWVDGSLRFKVTSIQPISCDASSASKPAGIPLAVTLEVEASAAFDGPTIRNGSTKGISFSPYYWKGYAANGTRMNTVDTSISQGCLADKTRELPDFISKGEKATGIVILDVSSSTGSIAYEIDGAGWSWDYPG